jgi:polyhydroxyalkanoate synthesis regulator protein
MIKIVKYNNRKLYSTSLSRYVVLPELVKLVRDNVDFTVEDHKSKKDITGETLKQALLTVDLSEMEMKKIMKG